MFENVLSMSSAPWLINYTGTIYPHMVNSDDDDHDDQPTQTNSQVCRINYVVSKWKKILWFLKLLMLFCNLLISYYSCHFMSQVFNWTIFNLTTWLILDGLCTMYCFHWWVDLITNISVEIHTCTICMCYGNWSNQLYWPKLWAVILRKNLMSDLIVIKLLC